MTSISIRNIVENVLKEHNADFKMLAESIGISEELLLEALDSEALQIRVLELISKELRIPLYSFFRDPNFEIKYYSKEQKFYSKDITPYREAELMKEIEALRKQLNELKKSEQ
ncbi:MAG: hypothetical protein KatS3mg035_0384 [Bacteroidia bacterium]|nr:MAG: hypothetical protein KatS3mg035_0384 [Bacteroidia bacterium]